LLSSATEAVGLSMLLRRALRRRYICVGLATTNLLQGSPFRP
jgi:hypothetical protein